MKFLALILPTFLAVVSTALACPPSAATNALPAAAHPVGRVEHSNGSVVTRGTTVPEVLQALGYPSRKLGKTVWIYHRYDGGIAQAPHCDCSNLVITFTNDRVSDLKLANSRAVVVFAKQMDTKKSTNLFAGISN